MEGWAYIYTLPPALASQDPADLSERIIDTLTDAGFTTAGEARPAVAIGKLADDGTRPLYVNVTTDPTATLLNMTFAASSKREQQRAALLARLQSFIDNPAPTQVQSVATIKDLCRAVIALA